MCLKVACEVFISVYWSPSLSIDLKLPGSDTWFSHTFTPLQQHKQPKQQHSISQSGPPPAPTYARTPTHLVMRITLFTWATDIQRKGKVGNKQMDKHVFKFAKL